MAATISFYLNQNSAGTVQVLTGTWVRLTNNNTAATFISTAASDSNGLITINSVPAGTYTVATGPSNTGPWTNTGDANFTVNETDSGNVTTLPGKLLFTTSSATIQPGATGLYIVNNANNANNLVVLDSGLVTARNAIEVPPVAGGSLPSHSYGTLAVKLDEQSCTTATASLTLTVNGTWRSLLVEAEARCDQASGQGMLMQFNADTGANYDYTFFQATGAAAPAAAGPVAASTSGRAGGCNVSGAAAGAYDYNHITITNADGNNSMRKYWIYQMFQDSTDLTTGFTIEHGAGDWRNTANAITSIKFFPSTGNFVNTRIRLYGLP